MTELTAGEAWTIEQELEREASALVGKAIFAFSRLDSNLGLMIASILRSQAQTERALRVDELSFHKRLDFVRRFVRASTTLPPSSAKALTAWLAAADQVRQQRNALIHGRWGVDPYKGVVLNIVGLPSSRSQSTIEYTLVDLDRFVDRILQLQAQLSAARRPWDLP